MYMFVAIISCVIVAEQSAMGVFPPFFPPPPFLELMHVFGRLVGFTAWRNQSHVTQDLSDICYYVIELWLIILDFFFSLPIFVNNFRLLLCVLIRNLAISVLLIAKNKM